MLKEEINKEFFNATSLKNINFFVVIDIIILLFKIYVNFLNFSI